MKKNTLLFIYLMIPILITLFTSCSDADDDITNDVEIIWEKSVKKGCLNKDPFAFGPSSTFNIYIGSNLGNLYYNKDKSLGFESMSTILLEDNSFNVNYNYGKLIEDSKSNNLYMLLHDDFHSGKLYEVDESNYSLRTNLVESTELESGSKFKIFDDHLYRIEPMGNSYYFVKYNLDLSEGKVLHSFTPQLDERVSLISTHEFENMQIAIFRISKSEAPYDRSPSLAFLNMETGELLWEVDLSNNYKRIHHMDEEMYVFINDEKTVVYNVMTGEELRTLPAFDTEGYVVEVYENIVAIRETEYEGNYPVRQWLKGYDLRTGSEVFLMEGLFLGYNNGKIYTVDGESILRVRSIKDNTLAEQIDLSEFRDGGKLYNRWEMANGSNLLLGQDDQCDVANLILMRLP